jgi:surface polysaccharide O-acyltransferase-like enzyme
MVMAIDENLSKRINSLRFLLIVFVVIIHNGISEKAFMQRNINAIIPDYVENIQNLIGIITAVAVPLFFLISGYLLYKKEMPYNIDAIYFMAYIAHKFFYRKYKII